MGDNAEGAAQCIADKEGVFDVFGQFPALSPDQKNDFHQTVAETTTPLTEEQKEKKAKDIKVASDKMKASAEKVKMMLTNGEGAGADPSKIQELVAQLMSETGPKNFKPEDIMKNFKPEQLGEMLKQFQGGNGEGA